MDDKWEFLQNEFLSLSVFAGLQRSIIYLPNISEEQRVKFREHLRKQLLEMSIEYYQPVNESQHEDNIVRLAKNISKQFEIILADGHLRIGNAQKLLNLFLKYLWCVGKIPIPPHCPFDREIIEMLPADVRMNWTQIDTIEDYRKLVFAAREKAKTESLAEWELRNYPSNLAISKDNQKDTN